jgi:hypothetical protein
MLFHSKRIGATCYRDEYNRANNRLQSFACSVIEVETYEEICSAEARKGYAKGGTRRDSLQVVANGLGAYSFNIGAHGAAFGVPNGTVLDIFQIMLAANNSAVGGEPWNSNPSLRNDGLAVIRLLNGD